MRMGERCGGGRIKIDIDITKKNLMSHDVLFCFSYTYLPCA